MALLFTLNIERLTTYAEHVLGESVGLATFATMQMAGGCLADRVYRHDMGFRLADGRSQVLSVVQKFAQPSEVRTMRALAAVPGADAVPVVVDDDPDYAERATGEPSWFTVPFYGS